MNLQFEKKRIETLQAYGILDTPPDGAFDQVVSLVAKMLDVPIALVTLVDTDRIWFKSKFGLELQEIDKESGDGLCASAILSNEFYEVENAIKDPRTLNSSLVRSDFGLQFYAAVPLTTIDGFNLGTLCVIDKMPRKLSENEIQTLETFAKLVMKQMDLKLLSRILVNSKKKMEYIITHELKNDLIFIPKIIEYIKSNNHNVEETEMMLNIISKASKKALSAVNNFIEDCNNTFYDFENGFEIFDFEVLLKNKIEYNNYYANNKNQKINFNSNGKFIVKGDRRKLSQMLDNLIGNSIKFSDSNTNINITLNEENKQLRLAIKDEGIGMLPNEITKAFNLFGKLNKNSAENDTATGLGLWIVKDIAELHNGEVAVESLGKNKGCTFKILLPILMQN